jgi:arabinan endo-1,5-alpha-L-arabinosidase
MLSPRRIAFPSLIVLLLAASGCGGASVRSGGSGGDGQGGGSGAGAGGSDASGGATGTGGSAGGAGGAGVGGAAAGGRAAGTGGVAGGGGQTDCPGAAYDPSAPPQSLTVTGSTGAHDPAGMAVGKTVYLYATGLAAKTSTNLMSWAAAANPLALPAWARAATNATNLWAPDVSYFGGLYHLYYAASTFGSNVSCIGHATRAAIDSGSWTDTGAGTICSNMSGARDDWNAIDPNVVVDDAGTPWLAFGSFWGGIKMIQLDQTGARADTMLYSIAARPNAGGALEGAWVFKRCGTYYLFTSWGACCDGAYDYNIRVGRASAVTGPYVDKAGTALMKGGGTLLVQGNSTWVAPGHNAIIVFDNKTYNVYHALPASNMNAATLRVSELVWDADGWPVSAGP